MSGETKESRRGGLSRHSTIAPIERTGPIKVLSIDEHPLVQQGIATLVSSQADMSVIATASNGRQGIEVFRRLRPDVTLMELRLPDIIGVDVMIAIRQEFPDARIIVLTNCQGDVEIQRALEAGAHAILLKSMSPEQIVETIRQVHAGKKCVPEEIAIGLAEHLSDEPISAREAEILRHVAAGNGNREIGNKLFIAEETVKVHLKRIMRKLRAKDRTQAITIAVRRGIIEI